MFFFNDGEQHMAIAGALGGVVRWLTLKTGVLDGIISVVVGAICAVYIGPLAAPVINHFFGEIVLDANSRLGLSGFVIGICGVGASGFILDMLSHRRKAMRMLMEGDK